MGKWREAVLNYRPCFWMPMGEPAGTTARDWGPNLTNGTYTGSPTQHVTSLAPGWDIAGATTFNGSSQYVDIPYNASALNGTWQTSGGTGNGPVITAISIACWVNCFSSPASGSLKAIWTRKHHSTVGVPWGFDLYNNAGTTYLRAAFQGNVAQWNYPTSFLGRPHFLAATFDNARVVLYVDAYPVATAARTVPCDTHTLGANVAALTLNADTTPSLTRYLDGTADEALVFPTALGPADVRILCDAGSYGMSQRLHVRR